MRQKTYTTGPVGDKKVVKNNGELPMYYAKNHHPAIIPRDIYYRVKEEMARRASKRKVMQKTGKNPARLAPWGLRRFHALRGIGLNRAVRCFNLDGGVDLLDFRILFRRVFRC